MKLLLIILITMISFSGFAQEKKKSRESKSRHESRKSYQAPWGMAGCDLWAGIIKGKDQGSQIGVYVLRKLVLNSQTSAITSGTSGCVEKSAYSAQREQEVFVDINLASLQAEAARGEGKILDALAEVFGCQDKNSFFNLSKSRYGDIYSIQDAKSVIDNYKKEIGTSKLAGQCLRIS